MRWRDVEHALTTMDMEVITLFIGQDAAGEGVYNTVLQLDIDNRKDNMGGEICLSADEAERLGRQILEFVEVIRGTEDSADASGPVSPATTGEAGGGDDPPYDHLSDGLMAETTGGSLPDPGPRVGDHPTTADRSGEGAVGDAASVRNDGVGRDVSLLIAKAKHSAATADVINRSLELNIQASREAFYRDMMRQTVYRQWGVILSPETFIPNPKPATISNPTLGVFHIQPGVVAQVNWSDARNDYGITVRGRGIPTLIDLGNLLLGDPDDDVPF